MTARTGDVPAAEFNASQAAINELMELVAKQDVELAALKALAAVGAAVMALEVDEFGVWDLGSDPADEYRERYWPGAEHLVRDLRAVRP